MVVKGQEIKNNQNVAIKVYKKIPILEDRIEYLNMMNEVNILTYFQHRNVVKLIEFFEDFNNFYLVMEYPGTKDLHSFILDSKLNEKQKTHIIRQICLGIEYLHDLGLMHRDIKSHNIIVNEGFDVKIIDFGLSRTLGKYEVEKDPFCTPAFACPNVLLAKPYNKQIDIWSLGVTIYFIIYETIPFDSRDSVLESASKGISFPAKKTIKNYLVLEDLISKCLEPKLDKRITIKEIINHEFFNK
jgi:serine/threonine protein kinase